MQVEPREALPKIMFARHYPSDLGRFISPDPSSGSVAQTHPQSWNRYSYVLNDPMILIDPDGRKARLRGSRKAKANVVETINANLHGYEVEMDKDGTLSLKLTNGEGPETEDQAATRELLETLIGKGDTVLTLDSNSQAAPIDDFSSGVFDFADARQLKDGPGASTIGAIAHALAEQYVKQNPMIVGDSYQDFENAHPVGLFHEGRVTGWSRRDLKPITQGVFGLSGTSIHQYTRGSEVVNVTITWNHGNIQNVQR